MSEKVVLRPRQAGPSDKWAVGCGWFLLGCGHSMLGCGHHWLGCGWCLLGCGWSMLGCGQSLLGCGQYLLGCGRLRPSGMPNTGRDIQLARQVAARLRLVFTRLRPPLTWLVFTRLRPPLIGLVIMHVCHYLCCCDYRDFRLLMRDEVTVHVR